MRCYALTLILIAASWLVPLDTVYAQSKQRLAHAGAATIAVPTPEEVLGFTPGDDRKLASWNQILTYFDKLDEASDRVKFEALGKTTMDKPFVMATISAPENLARLEEYKRIQDLLSDPRKLGAARIRDRKAAELIADGKTIVLITCGIHSTEVGSTLSSTLIAHRLASSNEPEIQEILRNTIILLVPSLNPDGVDIVKNWYDKTLGTPYEGSEPPELYHKYVGHDNNRDWYAFTQVETQITVDKIHNVWHPHIVHDIHQQGAFGSRLFLPPYMPPVEPNVPKQIVEGYTGLGNWMAGEMRKAGFEGITTGTTYDAWTPARAYSHYHAGVRMLSETASARLATPITVKFEELRSREGYHPHKASDKFGPVWRGGAWHLSDITKYMTTAAFTLLKHAAQNRQQWLTRFYEIGKEAVRTPAKGQVRTFIIPVNSGNGLLAERSNEFKLIWILKRAGVEVDLLAKPLKYRGEDFPELSAIIHTSQPYGSVAKALLQNQSYPNLRGAKGEPLPPYDVTAHNLAALMGVRVVPVTENLSYQRIKVSDLGGGGIENYDFRTAVYKSAVPSMDEGWTRWILERNQYEYSSLTDGLIRSEDLAARFQAIVVPDQAPRAILNGHRNGSMPPEYTGGLGQEGVRKLREFVEQGGTLVFFNRASNFAIEQFKLPVLNVVGGLPRTDFYVPGSILRIELDTNHPIAKDMPKESIAWVEDSPVFEVVNVAPPGNDNSDSAGTTTSQVRVIAWYPKEKDPLLSGWLLGGDRIKGKAALVEVTMGRGRMILFGFRPQYRAQSLATYPLLFNSLR